MFFAFPFDQDFTRQYRIDGYFAIQTYRGNYVTAVNGGGMGESANRLPLHTDATYLTPTNWEKFKLIELGNGYFCIQTINRFFITAINGGGKGDVANPLPLHSNTTKIDSWEKFKLIDLHDGYHAIQTVNGRYLTAINGGGMVDPSNKSAFHTDAKLPCGTWEWFKLISL